PRRASTSHGAGAHEARLDRTLALRAGLYDSMRAVPRSGYLANQAGLLAALLLEGAGPAVPEVQPFVRAGFYGDGRRAGSLTALLGVMVRYELVPGREREPVALVSAASGSRRRSRASPRSRRGTSSSYQKTTQK